MTPAATNIASGIPVRNAWYLLLYAWDMASWRDRWKAESEDAPHLLGLLAKILAHGSRQLLRHQLRRSFARTAASVRGIRGRIDFAASLKRQSFQRGVVDCVFPELSIDTLRNRIIRSATTAGSSTGLQRARTRKPVRRRARCRCFQSLAGRTRWSSPCVPCCRGKRYCGVHGSG